MNIQNLTPVIMQFKKQWVIVFCALLPHGDQGMYYCSVDSGLNSGLRLSCRGKEIWVWILAWLLPSQNLSLSFLICVKKER